MSETVYAHGGEPGDESRIEIGPLHEDEHGQTTAVYLEAFDLSGPHRLTACLMLTADDVAALIAALKLYEPDLATPAPTTPSADA